MCVLKFQTSVVLVLRHDVINYERPMFTRLGFTEDSRDAIEPIGGIVSLIFLSA